MRFEALIESGTFIMVRTLLALLLGSPLMSAQVWSTEVSAERSTAGVVVNIDGELFAEYRTASGPQPAIWPIIGPTAVPMTRSYPLGPLLDGEKKDHAHHRSLWFAHGIVNGHDFWTVSKTIEIGGLTNGIVHREFDKVESDGQQAVIVTRNDWNMDGSKICEDQRTIVFGADDRMRWIDYTIQIRASEGDLTFGDTKEGTFAVRVAGPMKVKAGLGGRIVNSQGQQDAAAWGQPAEWVDYCGPIEGETVGVSILSHPANFRHPCRWHVRTYGLFAANPFGAHHFPDSDVQQGAVTIPGGDSLTLRYRVLFHRGDAREANIEKVYRDYVATTANGLVAHWPLDDADQIARDVVGGHDGRVIGATATKGRIGGALQFGGEQTGHHVSVPFDPAFQLHSFTVAAWVKLAAEPTFSGVLGTRHGAEHTFDLKVNVDYTHGDIGDGARWIEKELNIWKDDVGSNDQGGDLQLGRWYHLAWAVNNDQKQCRLFIDGDLKKTIPFAGKPVFMLPGRQLHIGHSSGTEFMNGAIDDVRIYSAALEAHDVSELVRSAEMQRTNTNHR